MIDEVFKWFFDQGVLGVMLIVSLFVNFKLLKVVTDVLEKNTIALTKFTTLLESNKNAG